RHRAGEDEARQVVVVALEHPLLEALHAGEVLVTAVANAVLADHDKQHIGPALIEQLGGFHENVEATDALHAARYVGDDPRIFRNDTVADAARDASQRPPDAGVDAVEDGADLVLEDGGEQAPLPARGAVAGVTVLEVEQQDGVASPGPKAIDRRIREVR